MKQIFILLLIFNIIACSDNPKKVKLADGKYFFFTGNCGTEISYGHTILVNNGIPDIITYIDIKEDKNLDIIYINGVNCQDIYVWEGRY